MENKKEYGKEVSTVVYSNSWALRSNPNEMYNKYISAYVAGLQTGEEPYEGIWVRTIWADEEGGGRWLTWESFVEALGFEKACELDELRYSEACTPEDEYATLRVYSSEFLFSLWNMTGKLAEYSLKGENIKRGTNVRLVLGEKVDAFLRGGKRE